MTDPITLLQRAADEAASQAREADPVAAVRARVDHHRTRRRVRIGALAAAVALVAGAAVLVTTNGADEPEGVATTPEPTTTTEPEVGPYGDIPPSPLGTRRDVALAPAGDDEIVVWGGFAGEKDALDDGAVYDRRTGEWREMARSPLVGRFAEGAPPVAVEVEGGVVIARGFAVVRWDRATDSWTELEEAPGLVTDLAAVGDRLVSFNAGAVLDLATGTWEGSGASFPLGLGVGRAVDVVSTGSELIVIGSASDDPDRFRAVAIDPHTLGWRELAAPGADLLGGLGVAAAWDGARVVATDQLNRAAAYDPAADSWAPLPAVPARAAEGYISMSSVAGMSVSSTDRALAVLDGDRQAWTPFPPVGEGGFVPIDDTTIGMWVDDVGPNQPDLVLFDPTTLASTDRRRQVGTVSVTLGPDDEVDAATVTDEGLVVLSVDPTEQGPCQVASGFPRPQGTAEQRAVEEGLETPSGQKVWFHDDAGMHWETEVGDQDLVTVECDDPAASRRLVRALDLAMPR